MPDVNGVVEGSFIDSAARYLLAKHGPNFYGGPEVCPLCHLPRRIGGARVQTQ